MDLIEKLRSSNIEDGLFRLMLSLTLQYLHEFVQSEQLSRRLVHLCARKISYLCNYAANQLQNENNISNHASTYPLTPQTPSPCPVTTHSGSINQNVTNVNGT